MPLILKTPITYEKFFVNFMLDYCVCCEAAFVGHSATFCRTRLIFELEKNNPEAFLDVLITLTEKNQV